ncbi:hypothetical protein HPB50_002960 [Hyalomma asiaticum]|uniref:Uncharacterized protein n=1 Tax=Hyalomma asiaticum TaxID=266040 RepID=A0ACB7SJ65_HYAAI|nr:hypothetical protein HPB50_002960 [Hyalomma asiaticum]
MALPNIEAAVPRSGTECSRRSTLLAKRRRGAHALGQRTGKKSLAARSPTSLPEARCSAEPKAAAGPDAVVAVEGTTPRRTPGLSPPALEHGALPAGRALITTPPLRKACHRRSAAAGKRRSRPASERNRRRSGESKQSPAELHEYGRTHAGYGRRVGEQETGCFPVRLEGCHGAGCALPATTPRSFARPRSQPRQRGSKHAAPSGAAGEGQSGIGVRGCCCGPPPVGAAPVSLPPACGSHGSPPPASPATSPLCPPAPARISSADIVASLAVRGTAVRHACIGSCGRKSSADERERLYYSNRRKLDESFFK